MVPWVGNRLVSFLRIVAIKCIDSVVVSLLAWVGRCIDCIVVRLWVDQSINCIFVSLLALCRSEYRLHCCLPFGFVSIRVSTESGAY